MLSHKAVLLASAIGLLITISGKPVEGKNASILVFGRSGAGISSTVRMLLGTFTPPKPTSEGSQQSLASGSVITEYEVPIPDDPSTFIKIVDIEGVTDDRLPEDDAYIQASLKTYLTHPDGLNHQLPTAVLIVSRFDDTRFNDKESLFIKMLKRITDVEKSVYETNTTELNILLFSRFMTEVKSIQRSPRKKLASLKAAALEYVKAISPNIETLVGENKGADYDLTWNENGTYRLPNREFYPSNVFDTVVKVAEKNEDLGKATVEAFAALRFNPERAGETQAVRRPFTVAPNQTDIDFFTRTIVRSGREDIEDNEVNSALQTTFENLADANEKTRVATIVPIVQAFLQSQNLTRLVDLPSSGLDKVKLFQSLPIAIQPDIVNLLQKSLNLSMPPFIQSLIVGHGYDVRNDEVLPSTSIPFSPVEMNTWTFSGMGYLLPSFMSCNKLPHDEIQRYMYFADGLQDSLTQRQTYLHYPEKAAFNLSIFEGQLRLGFNVRPANDDVPALSSVKEIRTHKMELNDRFQLSNAFLESVELLSPFNSADRDSEKEWKSFFGQWGTHVISSGFVGGFIQGTVISDDIRAAYESETQVTRVLEQIGNFTPVEIKGLTFYGVFGGDKDPKLANVHELQSGERDQVVKTWEASLTYDPVVLSYQLTLIPISSLIRRVNETMGTEAERALELLLQGNLKYVRPGRIRTSTKRPSGTSKRPTARPKTPAATIKTTMYDMRPTNAPQVRSDEEVNQIPSNLSPPHFSLEKSNDGQNPMTPTTPTSPIISTNIEGVPANDSEALLAYQVSRWMSGNKYRFDVMGSYINSTAAQQKKEAEIFQENAKRQIDRLEEQRQMYKKRRLEDEERQRKREEEQKKDLQNLAKMNEEQQRRIDEQRAQELLAMEIQMNATNKLILEIKKKQEEMDRYNSKPWYERLADGAKKLFYGSETPKKTPQTESPTKFQNYSNQKPNIQYSNFSLTNEQPADMSPSFQSSVNASYNNQKANLHERNLESSSANKQSKESVQDGFNGY